MKNYRSDRLITAIILCSFILIAGCGAKKVTKKELAARGMICSFEVLPSETAIGDFDWETNGYVKLEQIKKYATKGKHSAQAVFSVPSDFLDAKQVSKTPSWIAGITISINTLTKLRLTDWRPYKKFAFDVFVPDEASHDINVKLYDGSGREYIAPFKINPGKNKLEFVLADVKTARIETGNITSITVYMDTKKYDKDVTLYIDNVRLVP